MGKRSFPWQGTKYTLSPVGQGTGVCRKTSEGTQQQMHLKDSDVEGNITHSIGPAFVTH